MSTEQDNFAGMTAQQKVKALILMRYRQWGNTVPELTKETIDATGNTVPELTKETIDATWQKLQEMDNVRDAMNDIRSGSDITGLPDRQWSRNYESDEVGAKLPDGSWVGWTHWQGGGKNGEPEAIDWISDAYDITCTEEQKMVTVRRFAKVGA